MFGFKIQQVYVIYLRFSLIVCLCANSCFTKTKQNKNPIDVYKSIMLDYIQGLRLKCHVRAIHDVMGVNPS